MELDHTMNHSSPVSGYNATQRELEIHDLRMENAELRARLAQSTAKIIEECAKVIESSDLWDNNGEIAKAVRALVPLSSTEEPAAQQPNPIKVIALIELLNECSEHVPQNLLDRIVAVNELNDGAVTSTEVPAAQGRAEPVAWLVKSTAGIEVFLYEQNAERCRDAQNGTISPLYAAPITSTARHPQCRDPDCFCPPNTCSEADGPVTHTDGPEK
jgi:hypothetical protein